MALFGTGKSRGRSRSVLAALCLLLGPFAAGCGGAGDAGGGGGGDGGSGYPEQPITWIVAFDPGGGSDTEARRVEQALRDELGQRIQIEYRSGGGGAVGWSEFVQSDPDGYTVAGLVIPHIIIQPLALDDAGYATEDIRPVAWQVGSPVVLGVSNDSPFATLEEFLDYAKANPGELTVGGVGTYSASDLALAQLLQSVDVDLTYVPVEGGAGPLMAQLQGGHVDAVFLGTTHIARSENARALAVAGEERFEGLPDAPTFAESGYEVTIEYSWGVGMPAGVPDDVATTFGEAVINAMDNEELRGQVLDDGLDPILIGPDEAQAYLDDQIQTYKELVPVLEELHG